eukprot:2922590-Lingulodinium_polyedra.AAC.1
MLRARSCRVAGQDLAHGAPSEDRHVAPAEGAGEPQACNDASRQTPGPGPATPPLPQASGAT